VIESLYDGESLIALILRSSYSRPGITFFTPTSFSQQLAFMSHPKGKAIHPHRHHPLRRDVIYTQEVLVIRKGALRVDFYTQDCAYMESRTLREGDIILLASGGHGFEVLEELEMVEIKQGPFAGEQDKLHFEGVAPGEVRFHREEGLCE